MRAWIALILLAGCSAAVDPLPAPVVTCPEPCERTIHAGPEWVFEPDVASNPLDPDHLVAVSSDFGPDSKRQIYSHVSHDGGQTWTRHIITGPLGDPSMPGCDYAFDPVVDIGPDGTVVLAGVAATSQQTGVARATLRDVFIATSHDGTAFSDFRFPQADDPRIGCASAGRTGATEGLYCVPSCPAASVYTQADKPWVKVLDDGRIAVTLQAGVAMAYVGGDDRWTGVGVPVAVDGAYPYSLHMAQTSKGLVAASTSIVLREGGWTLEHLNFHRFVDGAWTSQLVTTNATAYPQVAAHGDRPYIVYPSGASSQDMQDVWLTWPTDDGWQRALIDRAEAPGPTVPTVEVDAAGRVFVGWYHHGDPIEYRVSMFDGNMSHVRVDKTPILEQTLGLALGHYMGMASQPEGAFAVWVSGKAPDTALHGARVLPGAS